MNRFLDGSIEVNKFIHLEGSIIVSCGWVVVVCKAILGVCLGSRIKLTSYFMSEKSSTAAKPTLRLAELKSMEQS